MTRITDPVTTDELAAATARRKPKAYRVPDTPRPYVCACCPTAVYLMIEEPLPPGWLVLPNGSGKPGYLCEVCAP